MIHRLLRYHAGWEWRVLQLSPSQNEYPRSLPSRKTGQLGTPEAHAGKSPVAKRQEKELQEEEQLLELKMQLPDCADWVDECRGRRTNRISVEDTPLGSPILFGTLMVQISEDENDLQPFHFWMNQTSLVTLHSDLRLPVRLQNGPHTPKYEECQSAPEAFFIMIGVILETFHAGLDGFERRLGELERTMRRSNRTGLLDTIFERRFDLLHWSHLFIPIREVHGAAKEAFIEQLHDREAFVRMTHKLERIESLLKHYALEIDTLISMDDAISSFRGNDIMKTLTIFTVLFLPVTIAGAIWGVNFEDLPWKDNNWGFPLMLAGTGIITLGIYIWLWKKGWTGDLLYKRKKAARDESSLELPEFGKSRKRRLSDKRRPAKKTASGQAAFTALHDSAQASRGRGTTVYGSTSPSEPSELTRSRKK